MGSCLWIIPNSMVVSTNSYYTLVSVISNYKKRCLTFVPKLSLGVDPSNKRATRLKLSQNTFQTIPNIQVSAWKKSFPDFCRCRKSFGRHFRQGLKVYVKNGPRKIKITRAGNERANERTNERANKQTNERTKNERQHAD